jgi:hypothetical protein
VSLHGEVEAERFVDGTWMTVQQPIANLAHEPGGNRASQLLFGERFLVLEVADGQAFGQSERDGYVGWVGSAALTQAPEATHWVISPATHLYPTRRFQDPGRGRAVLRLGGPRDCGTAGTSTASRPAISCRAST